MPAQTMKKPASLEALLGKRLDPGKQSSLFALLNLGMAESLENGVLSADDAVRILYNADNCLFVRKMNNRRANEIMSRGAQLPDLFDVLPPKKARQQYKVELKAIQDLCFKLLGSKKSVA
jgi:hypothetical protein